MDFTHLEISLTSLIYMLLGQVDVAILEDNTFSNAAWNQFRFLVPAIIVSPLLV